MPIAEAPDGAKLHYEMTSLVPPWRTPRGTILMHHGVALNGDAWMDWQPELLAAVFQVIRLDMRGFGRSQPTPPGYGWSLENFFDDIDAVLSAENVEEFHFVGESIGGLVGLAYAARRPERFLSGAFLSTPFDGRRVQVVDQWRAAIAAHGMEAWADALMPMRFVEADVEPELYRWVRELQASCSASAVCEQGEFIRRQDLTPELKNICAPVLILAPDGSPFVDRSIAADLHAMIATSELRWFPGQRHSLLMSRARACARAYAEFLDRRGAASPRPAK
jgi:pimeloyl-ACP methyl ester carboxylesterase